jgi:2'-5' RNA ligase
MLKFKDYIAMIMEEEAGVPKGNYVSMKTDLPTVPEDLKPESGTIVPLEKAHITLIYSAASDRDPRNVTNWISQFQDKDFSLKITEIACFDSVPKEGEERSGDKACVVCKVSNPDVTKIHRMLKNHGLEHSYDEFSPHVTLFYDVDRDEAYTLKDKLNKILPGLKLNANGITSEFIDKDFVKKINEGYLQ